MTWLRDIIEKLLSWVPRLWMINPDEGGVRITLGSRVKLLVPGWYVYWPILQECIKIDVMPQVIDLRPQSGDQSGVNKCISGAVQYRIKDAGKAILKVQNFDTSLQAMALGIICRYVNNLPVGDELTVEGVEEAVLKGIKENARGWGLEIMKVFITDLGSARNIRVLSNIPITTVITGDE